MQIAKVFTRALIGVDAPEVIVEVHISNGLPALSIVGLPEAAVRESKDRVRAAIQNAHYEFPMRRITVNLAPADLPKIGGRFDLPIAIGILAASGQLDKSLLDDHEFLGELALTGSLRPIQGSLPTALAAVRAKRTLILPLANGDEAALIDGSDVRTAQHLIDICRFLENQIELPRSVSSHEESKDPDRTIPDLSDVKGQYKAKRALEIAAAGGHNILMIGPPGTGKSMLATRFTGILPPMPEAQALECAAISSISHQGFDIKHWKQRPFRNPHHTASGVALVGGGTNPSPGEISLAHHGVLFLDELTEFDRRTLDVLREPLETGTISISRAARQANFPAKFQLLAAMNPCPQGYSCDGMGLCSCTAAQQRKHRSKISAPLLDRIDMHIDVPKVDIKDLEIEIQTESSEQIRHRVARTYERQIKRCGKQNADLEIEDIKRYCKLDRRDQILLKAAMEKLKLSARAYHRILKLALTIADIEQADQIESHHLTEAISYRSMDRLL